MGGSTEATVEATVAEQEVFCLFVGGSGPFCIVSWGDAENERELVITDGVGVGTNRLRKGIRMVTVDGGDDDDGVERVEGGGREKEQRTNVR